MTEGTKVIDISQLLDVFEADEGSVESYTGSVGEGKTYGATRRAINDLLKGRVVYTNWHLILDDFNADQRKNIPRIIINLLTFKKRFYNIDIKKNWHYFDFDDEKTWKIGVRQYDDVVSFIADLTDCVVYLDEGQDIFDSYEGTKMSKKKRKTITRTRHLHKTLVVISQRYQAIPPTARANVKTFYKHVKKATIPIIGKIRFKVYATHEIDNNHMPIFDLEGKAYESYWSEKKIFNAYNSYYLREGIPRSQEVYFEAYDFTILGKLSLLLHNLPKIRLKPNFRGESLTDSWNDMGAVTNIESLGVKTDTATIKTDTSIPKRVYVKSQSKFNRIKPNRDLSAQYAVSAEVEARRNMEELALPF